MGLPSVNVLLFFIGEREREREREKASTEEPRDRFGDIGGCPQLFATFTLAFHLHTHLLINDPATKVPSLLSKF
jgi:hypothetical protein